MTPDKIAEIRRLAEAATPGPWSVGTIGTTKFAFAVEKSPAIKIFRTFGKSLGDRDDALYAAAVDPTTVLSLLVALEEAQRERDTLLAEVARFRARLEIDHCYDGNDNRVELSPEQGDEMPDGIECRDETIRGLDERIKQYRAEVKRLLGDWTRACSLGELRRAREALKEADHGQD